MRYEKWTCSAPPTIIPPLSGRRLLQILNRQPVVTRIDAIEPRVIAFDTLEVLLIRRDLFFRAYHIKNAALHIARLHAKARQHTRIDVVHSLEELIRQLWIASQGQDRLAEVPDHLGRHAVSDVARHRLATRFV